MLGIHLKKDISKFPEWVGPSAPTIPARSIANNIGIAIQPDYCGTQVDSRLNEKVIVHWKENDLEDSVYLHKNKKWVV